MRCNINGLHQSIDYGYYHGYTLFDKKGTEPDYPFGFGLSYTDFSISEPRITKNENSIKVTVEVTNTGDCAGDEVIQVYIGSNNTETDRPVKLLKGFRRISVDAEKTAVAEITVDFDDIKFYNPESGEWMLDKDYTVYTGTSSRNAAYAGIIAF
ncbi:MAG: fibronectin type III-like domain-contianing protein [Clostridia bacterium]|nr:fibronectin type III-like domain-contianing protein [Clostridia bacterium]